MADVDCPYYERDYKKCALYGTYQEGYQKDHYCLSGSNWKGCPNYTSKSYEEKVSKKIRSNPDL